MVRLILVVLLTLPASAAGSLRAGAEDPAYVQANARLARATPQYPRSRLLVQEAIGGAVGDVPFEAVQRVSFLARPLTQRAVMRFYARRFGPRWSRKGSTCLVSGPRVVVALVHTPRRRLGLLMDSRGARRCNGLTGLLGDLLDVGYPDP